MHENTSTKCLIISGNVSIGYQIAMLLQKLPCQTYIVHDDCKARDYILSERIDIVVADIDSVDLGGLAIMAFCHHRYPAILTYAIAQTGDEFDERVECDTEGFHGYFYLVKGKLELDIHRGMAAQLIAGSFRIP